MHGCLASLSLSFTMRQGKESLSIHSEKSPSPVSSLSVHYSPCHRWSNGCQPWQGQEALGLEQAD